MSFHSFLSSHDVIPDRLKVSDKIQRLPTLHRPMKRNASVYWDGRSGWVINWDIGQSSPTWWDDPNAKPLTEAQRRDAQRKRNETLAQIAKDHRRAAREAAQAIASARHDTHGYIREKGRGKAHQIASMKGLVSQDEELLIPMRDVDTNELVGYQGIRLVDNKWRKKFLHGTRAEMAVLWIGSGHRIVYCEGWATGESIKIASDRIGLEVRVCVCFSAGNLIKVARHIGKGFVVADNDILSEGDIRNGHKIPPGERAAIATGLPWTMPVNKGFDANDLHVESGVIVVQSMLLEMVRRKQ